MKMNCEDVQGQLDAYAAWELHGSLREGVKEHLNECAACRAELGQIDHLVEMLYSTRIPSPPANLAGRLVRVARERSVARRQRLTFGLALAAMLVLGIAIGMMVMSPATHIPNVAGLTSQPAPQTVMQVEPRTPGAPQVAAQTTLPTSSVSRSIMHWVRHARSTPQPAAQPVSTGEVTISADTVSTVGLELNAGHAMQNVEFVINIPEGFNLAGHEGKRRIAWVGELKEGHNRLNLHLKASAGKTGVLTASVRSAGRSNTFKLTVHAVGETPSGASPSPTSDHSEVNAEATAT